MLKRMLKYSNDIVMAGCGEARSDECEHLVGQRIMAMQHSQINCNIVWIIVAKDSSLAYSNDP